MPGFSFRNPAQPRDRNQLRAKGAAAPSVSEEPQQVNEHVAPKQTWGRGIVNDFKTTIGSHWVSEVTNFNTKTIAVSIFMFIAVIAPSITFGAVYAKRTQNYIGTVELLLATAWGGIYYSFVSGQPMMINGGTGPVLTFQTVCFELAKNVGVPFLTFNAWIGIWLTGYMLLAAFVDLNRIIKYATRFTDEVFAFLIVSIFLLDAMGNPTSSTGLVHYFNSEHPHNIKELEKDPSYDYMTVALLSLILGLGTAFFAITLRSIRHSAFLCNDWARSLVTDFAITIAVVTFSVLSNTVFNDVPAEELNVPDTFAPTFMCCNEKCTSYFPDDCPDQETPWGRRPWLVDLFDLNGKTWVIFMAAGPAALAFVLTFLDNGITWHIVNHPSNMITHGEAYNYDTCVSSVMILVNSLFGLPWLVASTVPCIMHITAMSEKDKSGQTVKIQESRLTGFLTHCLVLCSIFALSAIRLIPLPVLYGVFLFMGLVALPGQQLWQRLILFFQEPAKYPSTHYLDNLELKQVHKFTAFQMILFVAICVVRETPAIAICFPVMVLMCIPTRLFILPKFFSKDDLTLLDGTPEEIEEFLTRQNLENGFTDPQKLKDDPNFQNHMAKNGLQMPSFNEDEVRDA